MLSDALTLPLRTIEHSYSIRCGMLFTHSIILILYSVHLVYTCKRFIKGMTALM